MAGTFGDGGHYLVVENENYEPTWLKKGEVLGKVAPVNLVETPAGPDSEVENGDMESQTVNMLGVGQQKEDHTRKGERQKELLSLLDSEIDLLSEQKQQLEKLLLEFSHVLRLMGKSWVVLSK